MKKYLVIAIVLLVAVGAGWYLNNQPGRITGGEAYHIPEWFKVSFLEIHNDAKEASQGNKHLLLYMHLDNCPYCKRVLDENFTSGANKDYIQQHFDVMAINIRGDREIQWDETTFYNEKTLAKELGVYATPTLVFLNEEGNVVYQVNGYRSPDAIMDVMHYVQERQYGQMSLAEYVAQKGQARYQLRDNPAFETVTDFSQIKGPMAVIFEDPSCSGCAEFHQYTLQHPDVVAEMKNLKVVRLNAWSNEPIIDNLGNKTTPKEWAKTLKLDYRPGTVLFDGGTEITRADGQLYHFHYKELLRYVAKGMYLEYPTYLLYLSARQKQLVAEGVTIDLGR